MSRRLPIAGQLTTSGAAHVSTVFVNGVPAVSVAGARAGVGADVFVTQLTASLERAGRSFRIERSSDVPADVVVLAIIGSHVPRAQRDPAVHALWERANLLLADPSSIVADALVTALP